MRGQMTAVPALGPAHSAEGRGHEEAVKGASAAIQPQREWRANQRRQGSIVQLHERGAGKGGGTRSRGGSRVTSSGKSITGYFCTGTDGLTTCPALAFSSAPCGNISVEHRIDCELASDVCIGMHVQTEGLDGSDGGHTRGGSPHQLRYQTAPEPSPVLVHTHAKTID